MALDILSFLMGQATGGVASLDGTSDPSSEDGKNGNIYLKWEVGGDSGLGWYCTPDYLCTSATSLGTLQGRNYWKTTADPAIVLWCPTPGGSIQPHLASTVAGGVILRADSGGPWNYTYSYVIDGVTWYFQKGNHGFSSGTPSTSYPVDLSLGWDFSTQEQAEAFLTKAGITFEPPAHIPHTITNAYLKVNGSWQNLIGSDMADVG